MIGKMIRLERIMNRESGRTIIVPMDHGVTVGPIDGLVDMKKTMDNVVRGGTNAVVVHKGIVGTGHRRSGRVVGLIVHLSASTNLAVDKNAKVLVCTVEEAIKLGADAVSVHINLGNGADGNMIHDFGQVARDCRDWGMPLLAMIYPRGEKIKDEYDPKVIAHAARLGAEIGADIVKVSYTGNPESFSQVVAGCPVPVVIAGGEKMETDLDVLKMVHGAISVGGAGVSMGRNIFQHENPQKILLAISAIVHEDASVSKALQFLAQPNADSGKFKPAY